MSRFENMNGVCLVASSVVGSFAIHRIPLWWGTSEPCVAAVQRVCGAVCTAEIQRAVLLPVVAMIQWLGVVVPALRILDERNLDIKVRDQHRRKMIYGMLGMLGMTLNFLIIPAAHLDSLPLGPVAGAAAKHSTLGVGDSNANAAASGVVGGTLLFSQFAEREKAVLVALVWAMCVFGSLVHFLGCQLPRGYLGYDFLYKTIVIFPGLLQFGRSTLTFTRTGDPLFVQVRTTEKRRKMRLLCRGCVDACALL